MCKYTTAKIIIHFNYQKQKKKTTYPSSNEIIE